MFQIRFHDIIINYLYNVNEKSLVILWNMSTHTETIIKVQVNKCPNMVVFRRYGPFEFQNLRKHQPKQEPGNTAVPMEWLCKQWLHTHYYRAITKQHAYPTMKELLESVFSVLSILRLGRTEYLRHIPVSCTRWWKGNPVPGSITGPLCVGGM
jgi:hypothetical protein